MKLPAGRVRRFVLPTALAGAIAATMSAQDPGARPEQPRFRGGANLVRLDAYASANGAAVTDLAQDDFEVLEDGVPQRVETFEIVRPRGPVPENTRVDPTTVAEARAMAADPSARLFVLFFDIWHVHVEGSLRAKNPMITLLDRVIGQDDMVGMMTPEMSARNITFTRRTTSIESFLRDNWIWGQRQQLNTVDPREDEIRLCYSDSPTSKTAGIAEEMIDRRRERKTLDAIGDMIVHLEGLRDERKFVILLSEGWRLPRRDDSLARTTDGRVPQVDPVTVDPNGRLGTKPPAGTQSRDSCDRERLRLAADDLQMDFRDLLQRANRANISFYTVDPRGLTVFDEDLSTRRATDIGGDRERLANRQNSLRELAENTDGVALVNTSGLEAALARMLDDIGTYYLLGYYSTNTKLDGKFRKITVRSKRPGVQIRARPGYLAPTEAEAASARVDRLMNGASPGFSDTPPEFRRAIETLAPTRAPVPVRVTAASAAGRIMITTELDAAILKGAEWEHGATARVSVEHETGATAAIIKEIKIEPGQRMFNLLETGNGTLPPGRYVIRLAVTPTGGTLPLQTTIDVTVPDADALLGRSGVISRRGPSTGLEYIATADSRFRRTERIRFEVPRIANGGSVSARLLSRTGQALPLNVVLSERPDEARQLQLIVADLTLAPLAQGEYVLEVVIEKEGKKESASVGFRIVP